MNSNTKEQLELLSELDSIMAAIEREKDVNLDDVFKNINISLNPFDFLLDIILRYVGINEVLEWISDVFTNIEPIELAIKGVLLANVNATLSCHNNVFIPEYLRTQGINFNLNQLDYKNILKYNPLSENGQCYYFGTSFYYTIDGDDDTKYYTRLEAYKAAKTKLSIDSEGNTTLKPDEASIQNSIIRHGEINTQYDLIRAEDMNAFLWFLNRKVLYNNHIEYDGKLSNLSVLSTKDDNILIGDCTTINNNMYYMAANKNEYTICSNTNNGLNWYFKKNDIKNTPLFNISKFEGDLTPFNFKILDAPSGYYPINGDDKLCVKFLFDDVLKPNKNGHFSIKCTYEKEDTDNSVVIYNINGKYKLLFDKTQLTYNIYFYTIDEQNKPQYTLIDDINLDDFKPFVFECYSGLTMYEFNYDYLMGMKLFDTKSLLALTIDNILYGKNLFGVNISLTKEELLIREKFNKIIEHVIKSDSEDVSNCYFSFSNDEYNNMIKNTELKYKNNKLFNEENSYNESFNDIYDVINKYNNSATLIENKEIIKNALNQTINSCFETNDLYENQYKLNIQPSNIVKNLIEQLLNSFFQSIISPKIVLLFEINRRITQTNINTLSFEEFLESIENQIVSIITEIKNYLLRLLMDWALKLITNMANKLASLLVAEQLNFYIGLIKRLLNECLLLGSFNSLDFLSKEQLDDFKMNFVDYADIISNKSDNPKIITEC